MSLSKLSSPEKNSWPPIFKVISFNLGLKKIIELRISIDNVISSALNILLFELFKTLISVKLSFGESSLDIYFTPGHAPGHIVLHNEAQKFVIGGDVLFKMSIGRTDLPGGDYETLINSIKENLLRLDDQTIVYCGHGEATKIGFEKINNPFLK